MGASHFLEVRALVVLPRRTRPGVWTFMSPNGAPSQSPTLSRDCGTTLGWCANTTATPTVPMHAKNERRLSRTAIGNSSAPDASRQPCRLRCEPPWLLSGGRILPDDDATATGQSRLLIALKNPLFLEGDKREHKTSENLTR